MFVHMAANPKENMSEKTNIPFADSAWSPFRGCSPVGEGCKNCWARRQVNRFGGDFSKRVRAKDATFYAPLRWQKKPWICDGCGTSNPDILYRTRNGNYTDDLGTPERAWYCDFCGDYQEPRRRRVFVESLGDFWDDQVPIEWLADALDVIRRCPDLLFLIPSKRCENWKQRISDIWTGWPLGCELGLLTEHWVKENPPPNIWPGTSISTQEDADKDIPHLLAIPAAKRFLSVEPLLGPIRLRDEWLKKIGWFVAGGESGPGYRPMDIDWARALRDQCRAAGVPFWFKQSAGPRPGMCLGLDGQIICEFPE
jgi:protein gp37